MSGRPRKHRFCARIVRDEIARMRASGASTRVIADRFGLALDVVRYHLREHARQVESDAAEPDLSVLRGLVACGYPLRSVAQWAGLSRRTLEYRLVRDRGRRLLRIRIGEAFDPQRAINRGRS